MPAADDTNIIKLQLRKPKTWNWQLTTSKSSPHIALPTIQLFNSKGQLLIEARDQGMKRLSWSNVSNQVQRCRSDIIKNNVPTQRSREITVQVRENHHIKKSKSEILSKNPKVSRPPQQNSLKLKNGEVIRSRSEILEKLKKCSEESLKRAVADGYQKFLDFQESDNHKRDRRKSYTKMKSQFGTNEEQQADINHLTHKRYKTRTSSAGTLIIDESFNSSYRRRHPDVSEKQKDPTQWRVLNDHPDMLFQCNVPDSNCNYIVQEPITPVRDNGVVNKRASKLRRRQSIDSTSSSAAEKRNRLKRKDDANNKGKGICN